jgi:cytoskeleton protein RodZ
VTEVGRTLEEARLNQGITLDKVVADLKIRKHYLLAMESGRWEELPGYAYAVGFLRTYAEYLGLSGDELVEEYKTWRELQGSRTLSEEPPVGVFRRAKELQTDTGIFQLSGKDKGRRQRRRKSSRAIAVLLIIGVALIAYLLLNWQQSFFGTGSLGLPAEDVIEQTADEELQTEPLVEPGADTGEAMLPSDGSLLGDGAVEGTTREEDSQAVETGEPAADDGDGQGLTIGTDLELDEIQAVSLDGEPDHGQEPSLPAQDSGADSEAVEVTLPEDEVHRLPLVTVEEMTWPITLEAVAEGRCWVEVRCDGEVKLSRTIEAGESFLWQAREEIRIRFGRADVVRLRLNGQDIGPAGSGVVTRVFTAET